MLPRHARILTALITVAGIALPAHVAHANPLPGPSTAVSPEADPVAGQSSYGTSAVERHLVSSRTAALLALINPAQSEIMAGLKVLGVDSVEKFFDPKKPLFSQLRELRERVADEEVAVRQAQAEADLAQLRARFATGQAQVASVRAQEAQENLEQFAVLMYHSGGVSPSVVALLSASEEEFSTTLNSKPYLDYVSGNYSALKEEADSASARAQEALSLAQAAQEAAVQSQEDASSRLAALQGLLQAIEAELGSITGTGGPQKIITDRDCPRTAPAGTLRGAAAGLSIFEICAQSVAQAATPQAALAIKWVLHRLGAPYACEGVGRLDPFRFDCSSLVSRGYFTGAGIPVAGDSWAPSTRDMVPWDGVSLDRHYAYVAPRFTAPGDLILYDTGGASYRHVVMLLAGNLMVHTNSCGDVAHVTTFVGYPQTGSQVFLVARRVLAGAHYVPIQTDPAVTGNTSGGSGSGGASSTPGAGDVPGARPTDPAAPGIPTPAPSEGTQSPSPSPSSSPAPSEVSPEPTPTPEPPPVDPSPPGSPEPENPSEPSQDPVPAPESNGWSESGVRYGGR